MITLPKFSGNEAKCPECEYSWDSRGPFCGEIYLGPISALRGAKGGGHLIRICPNCGKLWFEVLDESCLDAEPPKPTLGEITALRNALGPVDFDATAEIRAGREGTPNPTMKRVYVAGPYSADNIMDVLANMRQGIKACARLLRLDYAPFCPWLDFQFELVEEHPKDQYYAYSLAWLEVSDMLVLLPGWEKSPGTLREVEVARYRGIQMRLYCDTGLPFGEEVR